MERKKIVSLGITLILVSTIIGYTFFSRVAISASSGLSYSPSSYNFGDKTEGVTDSTTFSIWNSGCPCSLLKYNLNVSCDWVNVTPARGNSTSEHDIITVTINTTGLSIGQHSCNISINSNKGDGVFTVEVTVWSPLVYDTDEPLGVITKPEVIHAIQDYFAELILKWQVIKVIQEYFA